MITKRTGNGQTECIRCKEKGKFALYWDSFLYTYNKKPYCLDCLFEILEEKDKVIYEAREFLKEFHNYENRFKWCEEDYIKTILKFEEILERGKNENTNN